ncbi:hypothetical protein FACS189467_8980 [Bacteroidia bacterium]|nr:hypothetical protein FACS189467_8980 [Bacteroidia bacterium]
MLTRREEIRNAGKWRESHKGKNMTVQKYDDMKTLLKKVELGQLNGVFAGDPFYYDHDDDRDGKFDPKSDIHEMVPPSDRRGFDFADAKDLADDLPSMKEAVKHAKKAREAAAVVKPETPVEDKKE